MPQAALSAGAGERWLTPDRPHPIHGVLASAQPDGRCELELHLIVAWPLEPLEPLEQLADELRGRVWAAAGECGLEPALGAIQVHIDGITAPGEPHGPGEPDRHDASGAVA